MRRPVVIFLLTMLLLTGHENYFAQGEWEVILEPPCEYLPLEFEDIDPVWTHLCIDSSFIGHEDTSARFVDMYFDGMDQLSFDGGSFIEGNNLFSITQVDYDLDLSGYLIEKIDLDSGQKMWTIKTDLRHVDYRERVFDFEVEEDQFIMHGARCIVPDSLLFFFSFEIGFNVEALFFKRVYDLETGIEKQYNSPLESDSMAQVLFTNTRVNNLFKITENRYELIRKNTHIDRGVFFERYQFDSLGLKLGKMDTVISSDFNNLNRHESYFRGGNNFTKDRQGNYYYLDQYLAHDTAQVVRQSKLVKYDAEFNRVAEIDLNTIGLESYSLIHIVRISSGNKILLRGCTHENPSYPCIYFYILLDSDLNHIKNFTPRLDNGFLSFSWNTELISEDDNLLLFDRTSRDSEASEFLLYSLPGGNAMDTVRKIDFKNIGWAGWISNLFLLDNGDYLIKINYGCYNDGQFNSWHPTWMRLKDQDLKEIISNSEHIESDIGLNLYPNPANDNLYLQFDQHVSGMIVILDSFGRQVFKEKINNRKHHRIELRNLSSGQYHLQFINNSKKVKIQKFIKM